MHISAQKKFASLVLVIDYSYQIFTSKTFLQPKFWWQNGILILIYYRCIYDCYILLSKSTLGEKNYFENY